MMKKRLFFIPFLLTAMMLWNCTETVDTSARYVFKGNTISDYLSKNSQFSEYCRLLNEVNVSKVSETRVFQLLSARGHFTVFAPTNDAIQAYLDTLVADGVIEYPSWEAFPDSVELDSIRRVIVLNSIIDSGDDEEAYQTWDLPVRSGWEMVRTNMNDRKLSVYYTDQPDDILINGLWPINYVNRDMRMLNGVIHQMDEVVAPRTITAADYLWEIVKEKREGVSRHGTCD